MSIRTLIATPLLILWMTIGFIVAGAASEAIATLPAPPEGAPALMPRLLGTMALQTLVLVWFIRRSTWRGARLACATAFLLIAIQTLMSQMETLWFNAAFGFTARQMLSLVVMGTITAVLFSPVAVAALGRWRTALPRDGQVPAHVTLPRLALLSAAYAAVYFLFGYFVAWQWDAVRQLYTGSTDLLPFHRHLANVLATDPLLPAFQLLRGVLWMGLGLFVLRGLRAGRIEAALLVGALFAVLMNAQHLLPNPYMPPPVQLAHFLETASSNALFGALVGWVLTRGQPSVGQTGARVLVAPSTR